MNKLPELGSKRNRNCVSSVQVDSSMCELSNHSHINKSSTSSKEESSTHSVWQQWTATFRASRRLKNDLLAEEGIDANVERHMTLMPNKKRSLFEDDSDSDDESNYYKLDVPLPQHQPQQQQQQQHQQRHPAEFTPSGLLPRLAPQQVTPASCDPDALPVCSLRRYGHDDDGFGCYDTEDRIPPPPSFHRYPSKKRAVGLARPEPEQEYYNKRDTAVNVNGVLPPSRFHSGIGSLAEQKEEAKDPPIFPPPSSLTSASRPQFGFGMGPLGQPQPQQFGEEKTGDGQQPLGRPTFNFGIGTLAEEKDGTPPSSTTTLTPASEKKEVVPAPLFAIAKSKALEAAMMPPPPPPALKSGAKIATSVSQEDGNDATSSN